MFLLTYFILYNRLWFHPPHQNWLKCVPFYSWEIFHCVYVPQLPYPFICQWTSRLLPCPAAAAKSLQLCPTLGDPRDGSPPGPPVPGILQARTLECVAISFSNAWKWKLKGKSLSCVRLLATPWTAAHKAPPSMGFSRQEYWSGVPSPSPHGEVYTVVKKDILMDYDEDPEWQC